MMSMPLQPIPTRLHRATDSPDSSSHPHPPRRNGRHCTTPQSPASSTATTHNGTRTASAISSSKITLPKSTTCHYVPTPPSTLSTSRPRVHSDTCLTRLKSKAPLIRYSSVTANTWSAVHVVLSSLFPPPFPMTPSNTCSGITTSRPSIPSTMGRVNPARWSRSSCTARLRRPSNGKVLKMRHQVTHWGAIPHESRRRHTRSRSRSPRDRVRSGACSRLN